VIDGSHRLSALSAWVNNDYGDGQISKLFYDGVIPDEQLKIAEETRKLINKNVGAYEDFRLALTPPDKVKPEIVKSALNLASVAIQLQWVEGDASKAENSFFKINQQAAPIDKTEIKLLESRKKPNSIAARAIIRSGKGHKYWSRFSKEIQDQIQEIAKEINQILFEPKLQTPIKTLDLPVGGKLYSAQTLPLILDFVNIVNKIDFNKKDVNNKEVNDDLKGKTTIKFLKNVRKIAYILNSNHKSSLGLHPILYFYSPNGQHRTVSFFAVVDFVMKLEERKKLKDFIGVRKIFEEFLQNYDYLIKQIYEKYNRDVQKSYKHISRFFDELVIHLKGGITLDDTLKQIISSPDFKYLTARDKEQSITSSTKEFNTNKKSEIIIKDLLRSVPRCKICKGLIHRNSISIDHIQRKEDGGSATLDNGQITHPYCNTGYKN